MNTTSNAPAAAPAATSNAHAWSPYQLAVFRDIAEGRGHTFVGAVAGSGKSTTMEEGLTYVPAGLTVLVCAFNKEIAESFSGRLARMGSRCKAKVEASTLHSYGYRQCNRAFGYNKPNADKTWQVLDEVLKGQGRTSRDLMATIVKATSLCKATLSHAPAEIEDVILGYGLDLGEDVGDDEQKFAERLAWAVQTTAQVLALSSMVTGGKLVWGLDFDDMIWLPIRLDLRLWQFDRIFVDEVQDLNPCQIELVLRMVKRTGRILAVGDERQAIYAFRGADEQAVQTLIRRLNAKTLLLSVSYRCPRAVVAEAKKLVPAIEPSPTAIEGSVTNVSMEYMMKHVAEGDFVLSRANAPLVGLCLKFLAQGRRAMIAGRDIGKSLVTLVRKAKTDDVGELLAWTEKWCEREVQHLRASDRPKDAQIQNIEDRAATIVALAEGAQSVNEIVAKLEALFSDDVKATEKIVFSTTHKAKGLERKNVWLLRATYLKRDSVEESNLLYVAVTRAQENLYLVRGQSKGE